MRVLVALVGSAAVHGAVVLVAALRPQPVQREVALVGTPVEVFEAPVPRAANVDEGTRPPKPSRGAPVLRVVAPAGEFPVAADPEPVPELEVAEPAAAEPAPVAAPATPPTRSFDVTALHAALAESALRCYPPAAKRYHLTGEATVDFCLDASGALASTRLASSTGQSLLDDAARDCVVAGALPLPREAAGGCYHVPVRFGSSTR